MCSLSFSFPLNHPCRHGPPYSKKPSSNDHASPQFHHWIESLHVSLFLSCCPCIPSTFSLPCPCLYRARRCPLGRLLRAVASVSALQEDPAGVVQRVLRCCISALRAVSRFCNVRTCCCNALQRVVHHTGLSTRQQPALLSACHELGRTPEPSDLRGSQKRTFDFTVAINELLLARRKAPIALQIQLATSTSQPRNCHSFRDTNADCASKDRSATTSQSTNCARSNTTPLHCHDCRVSDHVCFCSMPRRELRDGCMGKHL